MVWKNAAIALCCTAAVAWIASFSGAGRMTNPRYDPSHRLDASLPVPPDVRSLLGRACMDCHSDETRWPWYSRLPGIGSAIRRDVAAARTAVNLSDWDRGPGKNATRAASVLSAACADVQTGRMPKRRYVLLHPSAKLNPAEIGRFCEWTREESALLRMARGPKRAR